MRIKIVRATVAAGGVVGPGQILDDVPDDDAALLIRMGKAVAIAGPTVNGDPDPGAPAPENRDPKPRRTRGR